MKRRLFALSLLLAGAFLLCSACLVACGGVPRSPGESQDGSTDGSSTVRLEGAGATFPQPLYLEWIGAFIQERKGIRINYQGIGSGGGIQQLTQGTVDFGASDAPMKDEEIAAAEAAGGAKVLHIPMVFGAVVLAYNLKGVEHLRLDQESLAGIFLGTAGGILNATFSGLVSTGNSGSGAVIFLDGGQITIDGGITNNTFTDNGEHGLAIARLYD